MPAILPTALFAGYTANSTAITIPLAALPVLTEAEAAAATGDGREVARAIIDALTVAYEQMQPVNRPAYFTITRGQVTGVSPTVIRRTYTVTFEENIAASGTALRAEP